MSEAREEMQDAQTAVESSPNEGEHKVSGDSPSSLKQIWAIGGGKGGVGKTLVTANFAITLARAGARVVVVDLDLGGANLHTCLGVDASQHTLSDLFSPEVKNLEDLAVPTVIPNLSLISGAQDSVQVANLPHAQKQKLLNKLRQISADYILLDLGAGTTFNTLDFFLAADVGILVVLPEPTSIENAYRFIKSAFYRKLRNVELLFDARSMVDATMTKKNELGIKTPADLLRALEEGYPEVGQKVRQSINGFGLKLVVNQTRTEIDAEMGFGIRNVCRKYFGFNIDYLGHLEYDSAVWQSVRRRRPLATEFPTSPLLPSIQRMVGQIVAEQAEKIKRAQIGT